VYCHRVTTHLQLINIYDIYDDDDDDDDDTLG
jgi:hypothetical protein